MAASHSFRLFSHIEHCSHKQDKPPPQLESSTTKSFNLLQRWGGWIFYRHNSICAMSIWLWAISTIMSNGQYRRYGPQFPHFHNVHSCILRWDLSLYSWEGGSALISYVCSQQCIQPLLLPIDRQAAIPDGIKKKEQYANIATLASQFDYFAAFWKI